jgi:hypothetical protein
LGPFENLTNSLPDCLPGATQSRKMPSANNEASLHIYNGSFRDCHTLNPS